MPEDTAVVEYCEGLLQVRVRERLAQSLEGSRMGEREERFAPSIEFLASACAQGFLSDGCIDGTPETPDALYAALQPFVDADEEAGSEAFVRALAAFVASRERDEAAGRSPDGADEEGVGSGGSCESALASNEGGDTCAVQLSPGRPRGAAELSDYTDFYYYNIII